MLMEKRTKDTHNSAHFSIDKSQLIFIRPIKFAAHAIALGAVIDVSSFIRPVDIASHYTARDRWLLHMSLTGILGYGVRHS